MYNTIHPELLSFFIHLCSWMMEGLVYDWCGVGAGLECHSVWSDVNSVLWVNSLSVASVISLHYCCLFYWRRWHKVYLTHNWILFRQYCCQRQKQGSLLWLTTFTFFFFIKIEAKHKNTGGWVMSAWKTWKTEQQRANRSHIQLNAWHNCTYVV